MVNVVFFGSSEYSVIILQKLLTIVGFNVVAVVSKQDKPVGRKQEITPNPVAKFCLDNNLNLLQPEVFDKDFIDGFVRLKPDLALVVAYGPPYFTQEMIDIPTFKVVNIHPSPLPKYRGATPGPWQIINGETQSSVTFFQIDALPDHGPIISQIPFSIDTAETTDSFYKKAFKIAADNLESILKNYIKNPKKIITQDHTQKTYFPKFTKDNAQIDWTWKPDKIERFIRALNPWPIAWTYVQNQHDETLKMKILSAKTFAGNLIPQEVQIEGKKPTNWEEIKKYYQIVKN
jgi:methionyl-tRNA formyltransferase